MAMSALARLAASAPPPVFAIAGDGGRARVRRLRFDPRVALVSSPREATVLLVVGGLVGGQREAARRIHDQLPGPRGLLVWPVDDDGAGSLRNATTIGAHDDPIPAVVELHRELIFGTRSSTADFGGEPAERTMAEKGPDVRDGLALDRVPLPLGPFLPWMPPGLSLELILQGDVVQEVEVTTYPVRRPDLPDVFTRAASEPVRIADLERARARHLLEVTADLLHLHGLDGVAVRMMALAADVASIDGDAVRRWAKRLRWTSAVALRGVGRLRAEDVVGLGPVARASGADEDARTSDPAYADLGFAPCVGGEGDVLARLMQRLDEAAQALDLVAAAGDRMRAPGPTLELPRGSAQAWPERLARIGVGAAFDAFATIVASLDLDAASPPTEGRT